MPSREFATLKCNEQPAIDEKSTLSKENKAKVARLKEEIKGEFAGRFLYRIPINVHVCRNSRQSSVRRKWKVVMPSRIIRGSGREGRRPEHRCSLLRGRHKGGTPERTSCDRRSKRLRRTIGRNRNGEAFQTVT